MRRTEPVSVMCIDTDAQNLDVLKKIITFYFDYNVILASTVAEVTHALKHERVDLIFYNPSTLYENVLDFFKTIPLNQEDQTIPLIILDAPNQMENIESLKEKFFALDAICKPFQEGDIITKLRFYLKDLELHIIANTIRKQFVDTCKDGIVFIDSALNIVCANDLGHEIFEQLYHGKAFKQTSFTSLLHHLLQSSRHTSVNVEDKEVTLDDKTYLFSLVPFEDGTLKLQWHNISKYKEQEVQLIAQNKFAVSGEMVASIAHQWRQPLNIISLIMSNLENDFEDGKLDEATLEKHLQQSKRQVQYLSQTIDDFRDFFKPNSEKEFFCPRSSIEGILSLIGPELKAKEITTTFTCNCLEQKMCDTCEKFFGPKNSFQHVVVNLLNNAKDAISSHRKDRNGQITIDIASSNPLIIHIQDNGGGIKPEHMDDIFKPYFSTKSSKIGTGLGLYMAKTIVEKYLGGKLLASNHADGARFTIDLRE